MKQKTYVSTILTITLFFFINGSIYAHECEGSAYNRKDWHFKGYKFLTNEGFYSELICPKIDADHLIALKDANESGGCKWSSALKTQFANDRDNLVPSCASINRSKGSLLPAAFILRASQSKTASFDFTQDNICKYLVIYKKVKEKYDLSFERNDALVFKKCGMRLDI